MLTRTMSDNFSKVEPPVSGPAFLLRGLPLVSVRICGLDSVGYGS